jgi:hypothetical protein
VQTGSSDIDAIRQVVNQVLEVHAREEGGQRSQARAEILIHSMQVFAQRGLQRTTVQHFLQVLPQQDGCAGKHLPYFCG